MADRRVTHTKKEESRITALCNPGSGWSPRRENDAISDIENNRYRYYVPWPEGSTDIHVVEGRTGKYLRTDRDETEKNNLHDLPNC